jgi:hypothetical protein
MSLYYDLRLESCTSLYYDLRLESCMSLSSQNHLRVFLIVFTLFFLLFFDLGRKFLCLTFFPFLV